MGDQVGRDEGFDVAIGRVRSLVGRYVQVVVCALVGPYGVAILEGELHSDAPDEQLEGLIEEVTRQPPTMDARFFTVGEGPARFGIHDWPEGIDSWWTSDKRELHICTAGTVTIVLVRS